MKLTRTVLLAGLALPLAAAAAPAPAPTGPPLVRMQQHMSRMQQTMSELHAAKTAKQRDALLQTHMQQMMDAMTTMGETMGGAGMAGGDMMPGPADAATASPEDEAPGGGPPADRLQAEIDQITARQDLLQQMLEQMLQQQEAMAKR